MPPDENIAVSERHMTASGVVSSKPCWLYSVVLAGAAAGENTIILYDGQDTSGEVELTVSVTQYLTVPVVFNLPKFFSKGLYLSESAGTCSAALQFREAGK